MSDVNRIDGNTIVHLTITQLLCGLVAAVLALITGFWIIASSYAGGMRDDLKATREAIQTLQIADKEGAIKVRDTEAALNKDIAAIRYLFEKLDSRYEVMTSRITQLGEQTALVGREVASLADRVSGVQRAMIQTPQPVIYDAKAVQDFANSVQRVIQNTDQRVIIVPFNPSPTAPITAPR